MPANASSDVYVRNSDFNISRIGQFNNSPPNQSAPWLLNASLDVLGTLPPGAALSYVFTDASTMETISSDNLTDVTYSNSTITGAAMLDPSIYEIWCPRGLGSWNLHDLTVSVVDCSGTTLASVNKRTGFRTIISGTGHHNYQRNLADKGS